MRWTVAQECQPIEKQWKISRWGIYYTRTVHLVPTGARFFALKVAIAGKNWLREHFDRFCRWRQECRGSRVGVSHGQGKGNSATLESTSHQPVRSSSQGKSALQMNCSCSPSSRSTFYYNWPIHLRFGLLMSQFIHSSVVIFRPTRSFHLHQLLFSVIICLTAAVCRHYWFWKSWAGRVAARVGSISIDAVFERLPFVINWSCE